MNFGSTSKNISILTTITFIVAVLGLWNINMFTATNILITIISFYTLNILGVWMTLHRYYSHKSFEFKNAWLKNIFTFIAVIAGRGSPLGWTYLHRMHHAYTDTIQDPHSPKYLGFKMFGFGHYKRQEEEQMKIFLVKELMTAEHLFIHKWYILLLAIFCLLFVIIDPVIFYFAWVLPAVLIQLSQGTFNYFGHMKGYRNFETTDDSKNNKWLFPLILGEAWHNNHHANPKDYSTTVKSHEYDPLVKIIDSIKK